MMRRVLYLAILAPTLMTRAEGDTPDARFVSGPERVQLIELFTSEGCSSCPPADRWLTRLRQDDGLFTDFVPLAFHVDYWDYIGWKDRFARPAFSSRQRQYADENGSRMVYTPGMFLNGTEWNAWRQGIMNFRSADPAGNLRVDVHGSDVRVMFEPAQPTPDGRRATVALLGMNRLTNVKAGENSGRILRHDFVVLELVETRLREDEGWLVGEIELQSDPFGQSDLAIAAWVSERDTQAPLQATGGFLAPAGR